MADHGYYHELISAAVDGALSPGQREALEAHLASCPDCRQLFEQLSALHAAASSLAEGEIQVPPGLKERVMDAVAAEAAASRPRKSAPAHCRRWLASAAVLALVLAGAWGWKPWRPSPENASSAALPTQAESPSTETAALSDTPAAGETGAAKLAPSPTLQARAAGETEESAPAGSAVPIQAPEAAAPLPSKQAVPADAEQRDGQEQQDVPSPVPSADGESAPISLFLPSSPVSIPLPAPGGEESEIAQNAAVDTWEAAAQALANYIYELPDPVEPLEDGCFALSSPTGAAGTAARVDENETDFFLSYQDSTSQVSLLYSVDKATGEVTLLEPEACLP